MFKQLTESANWLAVRLGVLANNYNSKVYVSIHAHRQIFRRWQDGRHVVVAIVENRKFTVAFTKNFLNAFNYSNAKETHSTFLKLIFFSV